MFCIIYEFHLKPDMEAAFQQAWHDFTKAIISTMGSLGARLHRRDDGALIAYAQWPDRQTWERSHHKIEQHAVAKHIDNEFTSAPLVVMTMEVIDDLLVPESS